MTYAIIDRSGWERAGHFDFFRAFERPHYAVTSRLDVTRMFSVRKAEGVSPYRACLYAIGQGLHAVPELRMRFRQDVVVRHDSIDLSMTVPNKSGSFNYAYVPYDTDFAVFDAGCREIIAAASEATDLGANSGERDDVAYLSCLPWLDYTSINNALPGPDDCIPRVTWGKIVQDAPGIWRMAMSIEVHHALVDGVHVGGFFSSVQSALDLV